jgi:hypothetical protein
MDFDHALHIFRLYCYRLERDPAQADSMLLTDAEKQAIQELKDLVKKYAGLF